jgi:hypothetical protein
VTGRDAEKVDPSSRRLSMTAAVVGPFIALLIGFVSADRLLRWQLAERTRAHPIEARRRR